MSCRKVSFQPEKHQIGIFCAQGRSSRGHGLMGPLPVRVEQWIRRRALLCFMFSEVSTHGPVSHGTVMRVGRCSLPAAGN